MTFGNQEKLGMIVVMGVTGAGKSYLINNLAGRAIVDEGATLDPCTQNCQLVPVQIGSSKVLLVDTPGFDDAVRTDSQILSEIAQILSAQYELGVELKGVIYVHRITDNRYAGSSVKTFEIFKKICGEKALENVLLVTSRWATVEPDLGASRERELKEKFWAYMVARGSKMSRFHGDRNSAVSLASHLLCKDTVVLDLQRELIDEGKKLDETAAGAYVDGNVETLKAKLVDEMASLDRLKRELAESDRAMRRQIQKDWSEQQARLAMAQQEQANLAVPIGGQVQQKLKKKRSALGFFLPFVPFAVQMIMMFVGIPLPGMDLIMNWASEAGVNTSGGGFFSS